MPIEGERLKDQGVHVRVGSGSSEASAAVSGSRLKVGLGFRGLGLRVKVCGLRIYGLAACALTQSL